MITKTKRQPCLHCRSPHCPGCPSPAEILAGCERIRATWTSVILAARKAQMPDDGFLMFEGVGWRPPIIGTGQGVRGPEAADGLDWTRRTRGDAD